MKSLDLYDLYQTLKCTKECKTLNFTTEAEAWIKKNAHTLEDYQVNLIKTMLWLDDKVVTTQRIQSVYFTATHDEEIEQVMYQKSLLVS